MSESGWQIPQDWDGESMTCWAIQWPDSADYKHLLTSILYSLTRGREYDKTSGTIKEAQQAGWAIFDENYPLAACVGQGETVYETIERIRYVAGSGGSKERLRMVTKVWIDYQTNELVVQDGQCCENRYPLPDSAGNTSYPQPGGTDWTDLPDTYPEASGCAKASVFVDTIAGIVDAMTDAGFAELSPFSVMAAARSYAPQIDFGDNALFQAATAAINVALAGVIEEVEDADFVQTLKCRLAPMFDAGQPGITNQQYSDAKTVINAEAQSWFPYGTYGLVAAPMQVLWGQTANAIGKGDAEALTTAINSDGTEDCSCPNLTGLVPEGMEWMYEIDFTSSNGGWAIHEGIYTPGVGWQGTTSWFSGSRLNQLRSQLVASNAQGVLRYVKLTWDAGVDLSNTTNITGSGLIVENTAGNTVALSLTDMRLWGSGVIEAVVNTPYAAGDTRIMIDYNQGNLTVPRITVSALTLYGTGSPPLQGAVLL